jgi:hypothetical protein
MPSRSSLNTKELVLEEAPHWPPPPNSMRATHNTSLCSTTTFPKLNSFLLTMDKITRRKPRKSKGRTPRVPKTSRHQLTAVERAFIAGACIAGSLSHNDCAKLFNGTTTKSTVTKTVQRVNARAIKLNTTLVDPRCFEFPSNRGPPRLLNDEQRAQVVAITIASQQSREKES